MSRAVLYALIYALILLTGASANAARTETMGMAEGNPAAVTCPNKTYLAGFAIQYHTSMSGLQPYCVAMTTDGTWSGGAQIHLDIRMSYAVNDGSRVDMFCPRDFYIFGFRGFSHVYGIHSIMQLIVNCKNVKTGGLTAIATRNPDGVSVTEWRGAHCVADSVADGVFGLIRDSRIIQFGLSCAQTVPASRPQFIGTYSKTTPNAVLMQKRALYAENIDEPLVAPAGAAIDVQLTFQQCHKLVSSPGCPVTPSFEQWAYDPGSHRLLHAASGKCVNISGARRDAGAPIILYPCSGAANEKWTVIAPAGKLSWTVKSDLNGMCLHAIPGRRSSGPKQRVGIMTTATLVQMPCDGSAAQRFSSVDSNWSARNGPR